MLLSLLLLLVVLLDRRVCIVGLRGIGAVVDREGSWCDGLEVMER